MPSFAIRVELHKAVEEDYETLHAAMEERQFLRYVSSSAGLRELPPGTYYGTSDSKKTALSEAKEAAEETGKNFGVFVAQTETWTSSGLKEWTE